MSKSKKSKKRTRTPNLSPISMLRPRLDALCKQLDIDEPDVSQIPTELTKLTAKLQAQDFLPVLIRAFLDAPMPLRPTLNTVFTAWLQEHKHVDELAELFTNGELPEDDQLIAIAWLDVAGADTEQLLAERPTLFYKAYISDDVDTYQTFLWLLCYNNRRRNRVNVLVMCVDSDDIWAGSASMAFVLPSRALDELEEYRQSFEKDVNVTLVDIDAAEVKQWICQALHQNIAMGIRPDQELINERRIFMEMLAQLPDSTDDVTAETFTEADFDDLSQLKKTASEVAKEEKQMLKDLRDKYPELSLDELEDKWEDEYGDR